MFYITTTNHIEDMKITQYMGLVSGEVIGAIGKTGESYEEYLLETREKALRIMEKRAAVLNANAIVGVDIDYQIFESNKLIVTANGTAVIVETA